MDDIASTLKLFVNVGHRIIKGCLGDTECLRGFGDFSFSAISATFSVSYIVYEKVIFWNSSAR